MVKLVKLDEASRRQRVGEDHFQTRGGASVCLHPDASRIVRCARMICIVPEQQRRRPGHVARSAHHGVPASGCADRRITLFRLESASLL